MKKQITRLSLSILIIAAVGFTATAQPEKNNNKKEQQQKQAKKQHKEAKSNVGKNDNTGQSAGKKNQQDKEGRNDAKDNQGKHEGKDNQERHEGNDNKGKHDANDNKGKKKSDDMSHVSHGMKDGYKWDRETFKDRKKYKNQDKVTICHKFNRDDKPAVTIRVSSHALKAHMNHGDVMGDCPAVTNSRFSDIFLRKRKDHYNNMQNSYEQVLYSRSILDYALARLAYSRRQLAASQNNRMPVAVIERKQATVAELEQNVSILEALIGVAANLVANELQ